MNYTITESTNLKTREDFWGAWHANTSVEARLGLLHSLTKAHMIDYGSEPEKVSVAERTDIFFSVAEQTIARYEKMQGSEKALTDFALLFLVNQQIPMHTDYLAQLQQPSSSDERLFLALERYLSKDNRGFNQEKYRFALGRLLKLYLRRSRPRKGELLPSFWYVVAIQSGNFGILRELNQMHDPLVLGYLYRFLMHAVREWSKKLDPQPAAWDARKRLNMFLGLRHDEHIKRLIETLSVLATHAGATKIFRLSTN